MSGYQLLTALFLFSLLFFTEQFENTAMKVLILLFSIILLPVFFNAFADDLRRKFLPTILFVAFLAVTTVTTLYSIDYEKSIIQLLLFYSYFIFFVSIRSVFPFLKDKEHFIFYFLVVTSILSLISLYNTFINHYVSRHELSFLWIYFGHNHLSALLLFAIPLSLYFLKIYWLRIVPVTGLSLLIISLMFTFSIGALIALAISLLTTLILFGRIIYTSQFPFRKVFMAVFLMIALLGMLSLSMFSENRRIKTLKLVKNPLAHTQSRLIYWQAAYDNFLSNPLKGSGLDTFHEVLNNSGSAIGKVRDTTNVHNFFLQMLSDSGIFGFIISLALITSVLWMSAKMAFKSGNFLYATLFSGLLASTLFSMIDLDWHVPLVFPFFWVFAGLSTNYAK